LLFSSWYRPTDIGVLIVVAVVPLLLLLLSSNLFRRISFVFW